MTIVRYEPWGLVNRLHREFDRAFGDAVGASVAEASSSVAWIPSVDVRDEENRFVVHVDLPGVDKKDIDVSAEKGVLTIRGERRSEKTTNDKGYERIERVAGSFLRRFTLPETAQADAITAKQVNGVLEVTIPKQPQVQPRRISVEAA
jgi:HSP20 family protein